VSKRRGVEVGREGRGILTSKTALWIDIRLSHRAEVFSDHLKRTWMSREVSSEDEKKRRRVGFDADFASFFRAVWAHRFRRDTLGWLCSLRHRDLGFAWRTRREKEKKSVRSRVVFCLLSPSYSAWIESSLSSMCKKEEKSYSQSPGPVNEQRLPARDGMNSNERVSSFDRFVRSIGVVEVFVGVSWAVDSDERIDESSVCSKTKRASVRAWILRGRRKDATREGEQKRRLTGKQAKAYRKHCIHSPSRCRLLLQEEGWCRCGDEWFRWRGKEKQRESAKGSRSRRGELKDSRWLLVVNKIGVPPLSIWK